MTYEAAIARLSRKASGLAVGRDVLSYNVNADKTVVGLPDVIHTSEMLDEGNVILLQSASVGDVVQFAKVTGKGTEALGAKRPTVRLSHVPMSDFIDSEGEGAYAPRIAWARRAVAVSKPVVAVLAYCLDGGEMVYHPLYLSRVVSNFDTVVLSAGGSLFMVRDIRIANKQQTVLNHNGIPTEVTLIDMHSQHGLEEFVKSSVDLQKAIVGLLVTENMVPDERIEPCDSVDAGDMSDRSFGDEVVDNLVGSDEGDTGDMEGLEDTLGDVAGEAVAEDAVVDGPEDSPVGDYSQSALNGNAPDSMRGEFDEDFAKELMGIVEPSVTVELEPLDPELIEHLHNGGLTGLDEGETAAVISRGETYISYEEAMQQLRNEVDLASLKEGHVLNAPGKWYHGAKVSILDPVEDDEFSTHTYKLINNVVVEVPEDPVERDKFMVDIKRIADSGNICKVDKSGVREIPYPPYVSHRDKAKMKDHDQKKEQRQAFKIAKATVALMNALDELHEHMHVNQIVELVRKNAEKHKD